MKSFRLYMLALMKDKENGFFDQILKGLLLCASCVYFIAVKIVSLFYFLRIRKQYKVDVPVISVGNITLGGTGKTPFTIFLAEHYVRKSKKPAILIRGYGADEHKMISYDLPEVPVFVGQDRVKNAKAAIAEDRNVLLLDDGFQHRRIKRNLNIVLLDSEEIFGNGFLFPRGILREPASSLKRADIVVLTKVDKINEEKKKQALEKIENIMPGMLVVEAVHKPVFLSDVTGAVYLIESLQDQKVYVVSAIGDPDYLSLVLEENGAIIEGRRDYPDHYSYNRMDVAEIGKESYEKRIDRIIVTEKDYVKLKELDISSIEDKLFILSIKIEVTGGKEQLIGRLDSVLHG